MAEFGEQPAQEQPRSLLDRILGRNKPTTPPTSQPTVVNPSPSVEEQVAAHQATIQASEDMLKQVSMDPTPLDKPIIEQHQANIAQAKEAISNLAPQPPTPEPPAITQIPVAPQTPEQPIVGPTVVQPTEEQKAA